MTMIDDVLRFVPVGEANAETSRQIWKRYGVWAESSVGAVLRRLVDEGVIKRASRPIPTGVAYVFWREAP
ncbi:MAG TPA: hypothetical protein VNQ99_17725 [Xanthobacteraceae bacterium]|nr:hypothetical protein [Xanthobacteraceae bacterium]